MEQKVRMYAFAVLGIASMLSLFIISLSSPVNMGSGYVVGQAYTLSDGTTCVTHVMKDGTRCVISGHEEACQAMFPQGYALCR